MSKQKALYVVKVTVQRINGETLVMNQNFTDSHEAWIFKELDAPKIKGVIKIEGNKHGYAINETSKEAVRSVELFI